MKYWIKVPVFASICMAVEAKSPEEALTEFYDTMPTSLCNQCSNEVEYDGVVDEDELIVEDDAGNVVYSAARAHAAKAQEPK